MDSIENRLVNSSYQPGNENRTSKNVINNDNDVDTVEGYGTDALFDKLQGIEDLEVLDDIFSKLESEMLQKTENLKNTQKENAEAKSDLDSRKYLMSELDNLQDEEQQKADSLREVIETTHQDLERLNSQQIDDLVQFENDVQKISEKFTGAPKNYESNTLMDTVLQLRQDLEAKVSELSEYRESLQAAEQKTKLTQDGFTHFEIALKVFEEDINDISSLNEKLIVSVEQLTNKVNSYHFEISNFTAHQK